MLAVKLLVMVALPPVFFWSGVWIMGHMSDRHYVTQRLEKCAAEQDRKPLFQRWGYDVAAVQRHWGALDKTALAAERSFLELDLVFPFLYGGALAVSLLMAWVTLDRPFHPVWLMAPVVLAVLADWTENLVQLGQIQRYIDGGEKALQAGWINLASIATLLKLLFCLGSSLFLIVLIVIIVVRALKPA